MRLASGLLALVVAVSAFGQVPEGDRQFAARAEGAQGAHAVSGPIDAAIAAYKHAVAANPNDLDAHFKLLRSYRFKGAYVAQSVDAKKEIYGTAKTAGEAALKAVGRVLAAKGVKADSAEKTVAEALRTTPGAGEIFLWDSVNWGEWAVAYGKLAAARQGAADRIRRDATIAMLIDPKLEAGAPARVLGRLHDQTPHIPFITGWASSKEAVRFLQESLKYDPSNKLTMVFLAEALVSHDSATKPKAVQLLRTVIAAPNSALFAVEDAAATQDARTLLKKFGG
jgi:tetratricopeptide (TPR) repeat protein